MWKIETKNLIVIIDGPEEARWSIYIYTGTHKTYLLYSSLVSSFEILDLDTKYLYLIKFTNVDNYYEVNDLVIDLNSIQEEKYILNIKYISSIKIEDENLYSFSTPIKTKSINKPVITLNNVDLDLSIKTKNFYHLLENSAFTSKHHFESNSQLYNIPSIGKISLFLKNFERYILNPSLLKPYMSEIIYYTVPENEKNRLDLISWYHYKTPELFWVIMAINNIIDPFDVKEGTVLKILPKNFIEYNLLRKEPVI